MITDHASYYRALASRDSRFDGVFFVGVTSTGIYCRPVCTAKTPKSSHCRFFENAQAAEKANFRPCLRCRPELAPGNAPVDDGHRIAYAFAQRIEEGLIRADTGLEEIADQFALSSRQLRRVIQKEFGVSPIEFLQTRRLLLAKQLLTETALSMTAIAFASGFSSVRRFNDAFSTRYRMSPTRLRRIVVEHEKAIVPTETSTVRLTYRPPYDWHSLLEFLKARALQGIESFADDEYHRTVQLGEHTGWLCVRHEPDNRALAVEFTHSLTPVLAALLGRLRNLFDLDARPDLIVDQLGQDKMIGTLVQQHPGLRVPGAFDGFELAVRAILGQQVSVKTATTLAGRFVQAFGDKIETSCAELVRLSPSSERIAQTSVDSIAKLGIVSTRAHSIIAMARACVSGKLRLDAGNNPDETIAQLVTIPGIGPWTAHYIAMRALRWPDAFPKEDAAVRNNLGGVTPKQAEAMSYAWQPWRSYAVLHLWKNSIHKPS
jgi:AraC family transcriptional regulator of adaptative response / DNA-3-methyladenine glycosylase II